MSNVYSKQCIVYLQYPEIIVSIQMVQVTGNLKVRSPATGMESKSEPEVLGLVAECRLIESSPSILEISIPQSSFTSTINLSLNIISVDTRWAGDCHMT